MEEISSFDSALVGAPTLPKIEDSVPSAAGDRAALVDVAIPVRVSSTFHYRIDSEVVKSLQLGSVIQVPLRGRSTFAFVLGFPVSSDIDPGKLKAVEEVLVAEPLFDEPMYRFLRWVSDYYCHPIGEVIAAAVPKQYWKKGKSKRKSSKPKVDSLSRLGDQGATPVQRPKLTDEQSFALAKILDPADNRPVLLHGVTGSGKTEVYMSVLERVQAEGKGAIILVPEIALTPQLTDRFSARFPGQVAVLHSDLTVKERFHQWERIRTGLAKIVVGARSAVFAPVKDLGLIVVDEEQEGSFKQEESVRYHGRDIAIKRAGMTGAKIVLGSATPSLESYQNAQSGKYNYVTLKNRVHNRPMPKTTFVDLRDSAQFYSASAPWLSRYLISRIAVTLKQKGQSLLYLNRLGFAHFLFCKDCGNTWRCKNCDVALTYYQSPPQLKCHYCGVAKAPPKTCEECQGHSLDTIGVGTEQVEKELKIIFPESRIARMDRGRIKNRADLESILNAIAAREIDIVVGTQMIAKGHDFPGIALVGILVADSSLNLPDFRAHERTFQAITQVSGRAGRADTLGEVVIQTINPEHPVLRAAAENRMMDFYRLELDARRTFGFPPFSRMAMLRFQHRHLPKVEAFAFEVSRYVQAQSAKHGLKCQLIGPSEAPLSKLKSLYRWQCLVKSESVRDLQVLVKGVFEYVASRKSPVQVAVDVDPINSL